ncbi:MAG TPA: hypothetical protein VHL80_14200 [Polyangia bacterium]|nr:hypothetical protein [Polyangia bacterium]HVZ75419.1 hypothetical protein [Polyangia bacterium]
MTSRALATFLGATLALASCADLERGPAQLVPDAAAGDAAATDGGAALSFASDIVPLLAPCKRCHVPGQEAGDTKLLLSGDTTADAATVVRFVDTTAPASSRLLAKVSGQGHEGGEIYAVGSPEYETILHWIQQGAHP